MIRSFLVAYASLVAVLAHAFWPDFGFGWKLLASSQGDDLVGAPLLIGVRLGLTSLVLTTTLQLLVVVVFFLRRKAYRAPHT